MIVVLLALEYHAIVRWEERLLESRLGDGVSRLRRARAALAAHVQPRKRVQASSISLRVRHVSEVVAFPWRETLFSERGTLDRDRVRVILLLLRL